MSVKLTAMASCAKMMALITLISVLAACSRDSRATDIKQCIAEVQREISQGRLDYLLRTAESAEERRDKIGAAVSDCMGKTGYRHATGDMTHPRCVDDVDFNPYCYRRRN